MNIIKVIEILPQDVFLDQQLYLQQLLVKKLLDYLLVIELI